MRVLTDQYGRVWTDDDTKKCCRCKEFLPVTEFGGITKIADYCRPCKRIVEKTNHSKNIEKRRAQNNAAAARRYLRNRLLLDDYCVGKSCIDCGEDDPIVFEFDHIDQSTKREPISDMLGSHNWENSILPELEKCVIRCANCHRKRTALQLGWRVKGGGAQ